MADRSSRFSKLPATAAVLLAAALALQGCAKKHLYPGERRPDAQVAYIEAERFLLAGVEFMIDGKDVGSLAQYYVPPGVSGSWFLGKPTVGASVLPGEHRISAHVARYGAITAAQTACAALVFRTDAGQRYKLFIENGVLVARNVATRQAVAQTSFADCLPQAEIPPERRSQPALRLDRYLDISKGGMATLNRPLDPHAPGSFRGAPDLSGPSRAPKAPNEEPRSPPRPKGRTLPARRDARPRLPRRP